MLLTLAGLLGLAVGSFINVVAARVPAGQSVIHPRSTCPTCATSLRARDTIPVVSWLLLHRRCRYCHHPIRWTYPATELATAAIWVALTAWAVTTAPNGIMLNPLLPLLLVQTAFGVALWRIDVAHLRLPDTLTLPQYPLILVGLTFAGLTTGNWPITRTVASAALWLGIFGTVWWFTYGRGFGFGDVKLAPTLALTLGWISWQASLVGLAMTLLYGMIVGIVLLTARTHTLRSRIPFGPFLLAGALTSVFAADPISRWYLTSVGLT